MKLAVDGTTGTFANAELACFLFYSPFSNFTKSQIFLLLASIARCNYTRSHLTRDLINHVAPSQHKLGPD